jgi:hypothetical protein
VGREQAPGRWWSGIDRISLILTCSMENPPSTEKWLTSDTIVTILYYGSYFLIGLKSQLSMNIHARAMGRRLFVFPRLFGFSKPRSSAHSQALEDKNSGGPSCRKMGTVRFRSGMWERKSC